jgi:hypothetical protein
LKDDVGGLVQDTQEGDLSTSPNHRQKMVPLPMAASYNHQPMIKILAFDDR